MGWLDKILQQSPEDLEAHGDVYTQDKAWVLARAKYESALLKLHRDPFIPAYRKDILHQKIRSAEKALVSDHLENIGKLIQLQQFDEALELLDLLQALTDGELALNKADQLTEQIAEARRDAEKEVDSRTSEEARLTDDDETTFTVLVASLPEPQRGEYHTYGEDFRNGYLALNNAEFEIAEHYLQKAMTSNKPQGFIQLELATALINLERMEDAKILLERFIREHPQTLPAYPELCEIYWQEKNYHLAEHLLSTLPTELENSSAILTLCAENCYRSGKYTDATLLYTKLLEDHGWDMDIAMKLSKVHMALQDLSAANKVNEIITANFERSRKNMPIEMQRKYARFIFAAGDRGATLLQLCLSLAKEDPDNAKEYYVKVSVIFNSWDDEDAAEKYRLLSQEA